MNGLIPRGENLNFTTAIQNLIKNSCIIDFGIIRKVVAKGIVDVELSVAGTKNDIVCITCVLANISSSALTLNIEPNVGDKVIIFYPRRYSEDMFDVKNTETIIREGDIGYNLMSGIALLFNQFRTNSHKNFVHISQDGALDLELLYDEENDKNKVSLVVDNEGAVELVSNDTTIDIKADGSMSVSGKADITVDTSGNVTINAKTGKISLQNSTANLFSILDGVLQILNTNMATAGSPASHTVVPGQFTTQKTLLGQLMK